MEFGAFSSSTLVDVSPSPRDKPRDIRDIYNPKGFNLAHKTQLRTYAQNAVRPLTARAALLA